eukprot:scaffold21972_cov123-Isochrysis_galbana.AAC.1
MPGVHPLPVPSMGNASATAPPCDSGAAAVKAGASRRVASSTGVSAQWVGSIPGGQIRNESEAEGSRVSRARHATSVEAIDESR